MRRGLRWPAAAVLGAIAIVGAFLYGRSVGEDKQSSPAPDTGEGPTIDDGPSIEATDLADGDPIVIVGQGFTPRANIGVAICLEDALEQQDLDFCDLRTQGSEVADSAGAFELTHGARVLIQTPSTGQVNCSESSGTCVIAAANISDLEEAAAVPLRFDADAPAAPTPTLSVSDIELDTREPTVTISGRDFPPNASIRANICLRREADDQPDLLACDYDRTAIIAVGSAGRFSADLFVPSLQRESEITDCAEEPAACVATTGQSIQELVYTQLG